MTLPALALAYLTAAGTTLAPQTECRVTIEQPGCTQILWMQPSDTYVVHGPATITFDLFPVVTHPAEKELPEWTIHEPSGCRMYSPSYQYSQWIFTVGGDTDVNMDGDNGTDADIEEFFAAIAGRGTHTGSSDWNADGDVGTDADIEAFYRSLAGAAP